jgi:hypothetical protein
MLRLTSWRWPHASSPLNWGRGTASSTRRRSLLRRWLAILLVVAVVLRRRLLPRLLGRVAILLGVVPATALVVMAVIPLLVLPLVVAVVVVLLVVLGIVARGLSRLRRGALVVVLLLSRRLLVLVGVVLPLLLWVGHWRRHARERSADALLPKLGIRSWRKAHSVSWSVRMVAGGRNSATRGESGVKPCRGEE